MEENQFDAQSAVNSYLSGSINHATAARAGVSIAADTNPDTEAELKAIAQRTGVPIAAVREFPQDVKRQDQLDSIDFNGLARSSPTTTNTLADIEKAKIVHDDIPNLSSIESALQFGKDAGKTLGAGLFAGTAGAAGAVEAVNKNLGDLFDPVIPDGYNPWYKQVANLQTLRHQQQAWSDYLKPEATTTLGKGVVSGVMSLAQNLPTLGAAIVTRNPNLALSAMTGMTFGQTYGEDTDKGINTPAATVHATANAATEYVTEKFGIDRFFGDLTAGSSVLKTMLHQVVPELVGEQAATAIQGLNDWTVLHPDKPVKDYLDTMPEAAAETLVATVVGMGGNAALLKTIDTVQNASNLDLGKAKNAGNTFLNLEQLKQLLAASKVHKRDPGLMHDFIEQAAETSDVKNLYIDAQTLMQSGVADKLAEVLPDVAEQLPDALVSGNEIQIPIADYLTHIANTDLDTNLSDHLRIEGEDYTRATAKDYIDNHAEELKTQLDKAVEEHQVDDAFKTSTDSVKSIIKSQLDTASHFDGSVNDAYASLVANFYAVHAQKLGTTPEELYQQYPLKVDSLLSEGQVFGQGKPVHNTTELGAFKTGQPVTFDFQHNTESATKIFGKPKNNAPYDRGIEPSGRYVTQVKDASKVDTSGHYISGPLSFKNPLVLNVETWKKDLFDHYKKRGKALSKALIADGYDGVVTISHDERPGLSDTSEILDLTTFDESKALYQSANDEPLLAPNGKPSNLNPKQWAQVRTEAFKKWFGDWETVANLSWLDYGDPIVSMAGDEIPVLEGMAKLADWIAQNWIDRKETVIDRSDLGEITIDRKTVKDSASHGLSKSKVQAYYLVPEVLKNGVLLGEMPPQDNKPRANVIAAPVKIGNDQYKMYIEVRHDENMQRMYVHEVVLREDDSTGAFKTSAATHKEAKPQGAPRGALFSFIQNLRDVKSSKVVDENGEPLVVYHGTTENFTEFAGRQNWKAQFKEDIGTSYFTSDKEMAKGYANGKNPIAVFLSLKNPYQYDADGMSYFGANYNSLTKAREDEHDGVIITNVEDTSAGQEERLIDTYITFSPNQIKSATENNGNFDGNDANILHQDKLANRGSFSPSTNTITLLKKADLTTFLHETGHFFLETQLDMAARMTQDVAALGATPGQQAILDDTQALLNWFGIDSLDTWFNLDFEEKRAYHEKFAEGFEKYLGTGKAPSLELQPLFQRFRVWILDVYKSLKAINVQLTPEVKAVMNRMIASDEQIRLAEQARSMMPLFETAEQAGMTPEDFAHYQQLGEDATNTAIDALSSKANRDMQWLSNARAKSLRKMQKKHDALRRDIRSEIRTQVMSQPVYQAWAFLTGKLPKDNQEQPDTFAGRIELTALQGMNLPPEIEQRIIKLKMTAKQGLNADVVSDIVPGFSSGDALLRAIAAAEDPKALIEKLTDQTMLERHSELATPEAVQKAADQAISNAVRLRFVATEANALAEATGSVKLLEAAAKELAASMISRLKIKNILPYRYARAEVKAAKLAEKALQKGNIKQAATEKRNQLINLHLGKTATEALEEVDKMIRYFRNFGGKHVAIDAEYLGQINALLDKFDLRKQSGTEIDETTRLRAWVQARLAAGELPVVAETLLNPQERAAYVAQIESRDSHGQLVYADDEERIKLLADAIDHSAKRHYKEATYEELQGLYETIQQIEHLGRLKSKLLTSQDGRDFATIRDEIAAGIIEHGGAGGKNTRTPNDVLGKLLAGIKDFGAAHIKVATWARQMDGGMDNGPVWRYLIKPANARASQETTMRAEATAALDVILRPILDKVPLSDKMGKGKTFQSIPGVSLNWQERFAILLNMGNESNLQRLMSGGIANVTKSLTMPQIMDIVSTFSFEELHAAQRIWDHFETYRPLIAEKEKRVTGTEPKWIPIRAISLAANDGRVITLRGGYYPVKFDARVNIDAAGHAAAQDAKDLMKSAYSAAVTQRSFTKDRVPEVHGRPLLLNMTGLYSGVNDVIHDLSWHEWVIDANRLLRASKIDRAIREFYGPEVKKQFDNWRNDIIVGQRKLDHGIEKAAGFARQFVSASALTFNLMSAAMQPLGLSNSIARLGAEWVGKGVSRYAGDPVQSTVEAQEKSEWMRNRTRTRFRELNELRNQVQGQTAVKELMGRYGYWLMMRSQMMVDVPTWWGGYEKAIAQGHDEETAIGLADQGVKDSQGGGEEVDQSGIERGPALVKLFTVFYGFMGTTLNAAYGSTISEKSKAKIAANLLLTLSVPAVLGSLLRSALTPGGDDGDDEDLMGKLIREQISFLMGMVAFGREFSQIANPKSMGYSGPTGLRVIPDIYHLKEQAAQGEFDDGFRKQFVNVLGDLTGLPAVQVNRTLTGAKAIAEGKTNNPLAIGFGFKN